MMIGIVGSNRRVVGTVVFFDDVVVYPGWDK